MSCMPTEARRGPPAGDGADRFASGPAGVLDRRFCAETPCSAASGSGTGARAVRPRSGVPHRLPTVREANPNIAFLHAARRTATSHRYTIRSGAGLLLGVVGDLLAEP